MPATSRCACHWLCAALKDTVAGVFQSRTGASPALHDIMWMGTYLYILRHALSMWHLRFSWQCDKWQVCTHLHCFGRLLDYSIHARDRFGTGIDNTLANALVLSSSIDLQINMMS